jgi:hypothetical protein
VPAIAISVCFSALLFVEALGHFAHLDQARLHRQLSIADDVSHAIPQIEKARVITGGVVAILVVVASEMATFFEWGESVPALCTQSASMISG